MNVQFEIRNDVQILNSDELLKLEQNLGYSLPNDYKQHMLKYNGGSVVNKNIEHKDYPDITSSGLDYLFPIKYGPKTLENVNESISEFLPGGYLPIGKNGGGGYVIMSLNNSGTYGEIKEWYPDDELNYMSPSFMQYLEDMIEREDY